MQTYTNYSSMRTALQTVALDNTNGLTASARSDLVTVYGMNFGPQWAVYGMERLYQEYCSNPAMTDAPKEVMGGLAQYVDEYSLFANGQGANSRAYAIWQTELLREGNPQADATVSRPEPLKTYTDNGPNFVTVPFPPVLSSVSPTSGPANQICNLILTGSGFTGATAVTLGGVSIQFIVNSDTSITAVAPGEAASTNVVAVTNGGGSSSATDVTFTYTGAGTTATPPST